MRPHLEQICKLISSKDPESVLLGLEILIDGNFKETKLIVDLLLLFFEDYENIPEHTLYLRYKVKLYYRFNISYRGLRDPYASAILRILNSNDENKTILKSLINAQ